MIRGLVTARPWCVAGLPLSACGSRVPKRFIEDCPDRFPPSAVHAGLMIRLFCHPVEWCAIVLQSSLLGRSDVMQAMAQTNPANSRAIAVTTTCFSLPFANMR